MAASGQWKDWHGTWGIPYIWTSLPDFGGDLYTHGNLSLINQVCIVPNLPYVVEAC